MAMKNVPGSGKGGPSMAGGTMYKGGRAASPTVRSSKAGPESAKITKPKTSATSSAKVTKPKISTGKAKAIAAPGKTYEQPVKGSGKPKYQNVIKEARTDTKATRKESIKKGQSILKPIGVKATKQEITRKASKEPNIAKQIDREYKEQKGVRTAKPATPKVPIKKNK